MKTRAENTIRALEMHFGAEIREGRIIITGDSQRTRRAEVRLTTEELGRGIERLPPGSPGRVSLLRLLRAMNTGRGRAA